jgi:hypothetical protein
MAECCVSKASQQGVWVAMQCLQRHPCAVVICLQLQPLKGRLRLHICPGLLLRAWLQALPGHSALLLLLLLLLLLNLT